MLDTKQQEWQFTWILWLLSWLRWLWPSRTLRPHLVFNCFGFLHLGIEIIYKLLNALIVTTQTQQHSVHCSSQLTQFRLCTAHIAHNAQHTANPVHSTQYHLRYLANAAVVLGPLRGVVCTTSCVVLSRMQRKTPDIQEMQHVTIL